MKSDSYVRFLRSDDYSAVLRGVLTGNGSHHGSQQASRRSVGRPSILLPGNSTPTNVDDSATTPRSTTRGFT